MWPDVIEGNVVNTLTATSGNAAFLFADADKKTYYDYVKGRRSQKKHPVMHLLVMGTAFLAASMLSVASFFS